MPGPGRIAAGPGGAVIGVRADLVDAGLVRGRRAGQNCTVPSAPSVLASCTALVVACSPAPAATTDFFGPTIEPPGGLAQLRPGMTIARARQLVPALRETRGGVREHLVLPSGVGDVKLEVRVDAGTVANIVAIVQGQTARALLTRAWGEPVISRDALGQPEITWASESTGWKVELDCLERNCFVEYLPYRVLTAAYFGAHVVPPGPLANLRIGMPLAEARVQAPGVVEIRAGLTTGVDGVRQYVALDDKLGTVRAIYLNLPQHAARLLESAWGPGLRATEPVGKQVLVWPDPRTGWRATLRDALGSSHDLGFDNYLPVAQLFGEQPDVLDAFPVLGRTVDELARQFPTELVPQGRGFVLSLPPTEWERTATRITIGVAGGRVQELAFAVPFKAHPEARDTLLALFTHKWGLPRPIEHDRNPALLFREADPRVEIREDLEHGAWQLAIRR